MSAAPSFAKCKTQIDRFAWRVHRRLLSCCVRAYDFEDIKQECAIAYVIAAERWNPESGVPFAAYLARGMQNHVNRWAEQEIKQSHGANMSLDAGQNYGGSTLYSGDSSSGRPDTTLHEALGASQPDAYELFVTKATREKVMAQLSPRAKLFVELFDSPPPFLFEARNALVSKAQTGRARGLVTAASSNITAALIFEFMDATRIERKAIRDELQVLSEKVSQC